MIPLCKAGYVLEEGMWGHPLTLDTSARERRSERERDGERERERVVLRPRTEGKALIAITFPVPDSPSAQPG